MGLFLSIILSQIWLSIRPIFTALPISPSFLICFRPVKYRIEGLDVLFPMVKKWSIKSWFWPSRGLGQTWSTPVNFSQTWSTSVKSLQTSRNMPSAIFWGLIDAFELLSDQTRLSPVASFYVPIPEEILKIKIRLWQFPNQENEPLSQEAKYITSLCFKSSFSHLTTKVVIDQQPRNWLRKRFLHQGGLLGEKWIFSIVHFSILIF